VAQEALVLRLLQQQQQDPVLLLLLLNPRFDKTASQSTTANSLTAVVVQQ
jgi:hypothetical protein